MNTIPELRVLLVCLGNICRSPLAQGILERRLSEAGLADRVEVDSAGTAGYHAREPPDARAVEAAARRGIDIGMQRARRVVAEDFERFDYVLAMDEDNLAALERLRPSDARAEARLLLELVPGAGLREVPDPYYGGAGGFERVIDLLEDAIAALVADLARRLAPRSRNET